MRRVRRGGAVLVIGALALVVLAGPAAGHAVLVGSDPPAGGVVGADARTVRLWFNEDISPKLRSVRLVDADGVAVPGVRNLPDPEDPRSLVVELPSLGSGTYGILWRVLSEGDGHTTSGALVFSVGAPGAASPAISPGASGPSTAPVEAALRWVTVCLLAGLVGSFAVSVLVLGRADRTREPKLERAIDSARSRLSTFALGCAALGAVAGVGSVAQQAVSSAAGDSMLVTARSLLLSSRWGALWAVREGILLAIIGVLVAARRAARRPMGETSVRRLGWAVGGLLLALVTVQTLVSHAASVEPGRDLAVAAGALHVLAACLWMGALPALVIVLWPRRGDPIERAVLVRRCRTRFSRLAAAAVGVLIVTGLYGAGREVDTVHGLVSTAYGRTLIVKTLLLLVAGGLGLLNWARLHGKLPRRSDAGSPPAHGARSRRLIVAEAVVGALLLLAAGVLGATPPARGGVVVAPPDVAHSSSASIDDLVVDLSVTPNRPGANAFTVIAASSRRPAPAPIDAVDVRLVGPAGTSSVALREVGPGRYFGTGTFGAAGPWRITTIVRRAGERLRAPVDWSVAPAARPRLVPQPGRALAPIVDAVAAVVLLGLTIAFAWRLALSRRRRPTVAELDPTFIDERIPEVVS